MRRIVSVVVSLAIIAVATWLGFIGMAYTHKVIRLLLPLPEVLTAEHEVIAAFEYLAVAGILSFGAAALIFRQGLFDIAERTARQVYAWGIAWGVGSLYLFLMSSNVFPHQLLVGTFVCAVVLLWLGYALFGRDRETKGRENPLKRFLAVILATVMQLRWIWAWIAVAVTLTPLVAAVFYVVSQEFRDSVAEFRVKQNVSVDGDWTTVPVNTKTQLLQPIMIRMEPGKPHAMLVLERAGRLYRMGYPDDGTKDLLIDFADQVNEVSLENGALGFDFDPRYGQPGFNFVYIYFTHYRPGKQVNYLARFDLGQPDAAARLKSQYNLMEINRPPSQYHNAGTVATGPDGFLYLSVGEMDMEESHQHIDRTLSGGILRIDVQQQGGDVSRPITKQPLDSKTQGYFIPKDNPWASDPDALGEFYAMGLRNPFRFQIDPATGLIWTGDVGTTVWEEVDVVEKGRNYQYPYDEGGKPTEYPKPAKVIQPEQGPVYTYIHTAYDRSVIGGIVYRGDRWPSLKGKYIFGDNYSGKFWAMPAVNRKVDSVEVLGQADKFAQRGFTSMIETPDGRILITIMGASSSPSGEIVELVPKKGGVEQSLGGGKTVAAAAPEQLDDAAIKESFVTNCARCHGETGHGDGPDAAILKGQLGVVPTNFHTPEFKAKSREEIHKAIAEGGAAVGKSEAMPPWTGVLEDKEIEAITDYVRKLPAEGKK